MLREEKMDSEEIPFPVSGRDLADGIGGSSYRDSICIARLLLPGYGFFSLAEVPFGNFGSYSHTSQVNIEWEK